MPNWTPPELWNHGIAGAFLDYNLYASLCTTSGRKFAKYKFHLGRLGLILGFAPARLITSTISHLTMAKAVRPTPDFPRIYLFRPIPAMNAKLTIGQYDTESSIFDSFHFSGISLKSDENMLPPDLRGYAPQITVMSHKRMQRSLSRTTVLFIKKKCSSVPFAITNFIQYITGAATSRLKKRTDALRNGKLHLIVFLI